MSEAPFQEWLSWLDNRQEEMLAATIALANINSGSLNHAGVKAVGDELCKLAAPLEGNVEQIPMPAHQVIDDTGQIKQYPLANAIRVTKRPQAPMKVFLCGHMDTVFAVNHPFQQVKWLDNNTINGPGVADLKGGLVVMLNALACLERSPLAEKIGWEILFNPDEEIGSPGSSSLFAECAQRNHVGMIYEPCFPNGDFAGQRKGSGNFSVVVTGKAAHAGREHHLGRNAIRAMADFISALDDFNQQRDTITVNPGYIHGGGPVNVVPDNCVSQFNIRTTTAKDEAWCQQKLSELTASINQREGITLQLHGAFGRPPKCLTPANQRLFSLAKQCGQQIGLDLAWHPTGGCCDGNNLAAYGLPNIDTLGVQGGKIHSDQEYMLVSSLVERAKLSALLLFHLANDHPENWERGEHASG